MRNAETILNIIRKRGQRGLPVQDAYRLLYQRDLYLRAYGKLYRNKGAMTEGATPETVDGMSLEKIEAIINLLRNERYRWTPVRRIYIPKKNGKTKLRPLGLPSWSDKLLQEVIRSILEAYYEPQFNDHSHGFRPKRGCHTALREVMQKGKGTKWFIEGDLCACFDKIDHSVLLSILQENFQDNRFIRLLGGLLKAGYLEDWKFNNTFSGVPQGSVIGPICSNQEDFIRVDTLRAANDAVGNLIHSLPIFKLWNLMDEKLLADADGQKLPTSESTIQSRYSKKYLGKSPGLSVYTLVANFVAVNAKNIGLNEYEGHSLYDMIYSNKTDVDIDMVTGDSHSLNQLNFVILDSIDVDYVPSIKNVREAANSLYSAKPIDNYTGIIRPKGMVNTNLIRSEKRGILRVLLSLLLQENTQSNIVKKLNSYARYANLKKALFEYNNAFKSAHVLNLIDSMPLRKAIRIARNRTEAYHQLQGLIRKIYRGVFKGKKIIRNQVSAHAVRLVANCIIAYNSIILNTIYEKMLREGASQEIIDKFARISPIAWVHIAFTGKYNFKKSNSEIDVEAMVNALERHLKQHFWGFFHRTPISPLKLYSIYIGFAIVFASFCGFLESLLEEIKNHPKSLFRQ